jgi:putative transcriptional regulator
MRTSKRKTDATRTDLDDRPLSAADLKRMKRTPRVKVLRRALGLTQEQFADRYRIPLGTLRDWEQGRSAPDQPAKAYLQVIRAEPVATARAHTVDTKPKPKVYSSAIMHFSYHERNRELVITFANGATYSYSNVPRSVYRAFRDADSKKAFYDERIKEHFGLNIQASVA